MGQFIFYVFLFMWFGGLLYCLIFRPDAYNKIRQGEHDRREDRKERRRKAIGSAAGWIVGNMLRRR